ncbi:hypothetical protein AWB78_08222 [Caballeronia calidae]|uniref:Uncharacterized protein n=1 Tax=Caballeronia calidae TaxID=1777139 RepID=A0A158EIZ1_9BURK|nr:hypothetical protein [Caballeronia calidae]SAL06743.1 hypothetical protein AWB78_08222 [Caballeronia calidae]
MKEINVSFSSTPDGGIINNSSNQPLTKKSNSQKEQSGGAFEGLKHMNLERYAADISGAENNSTQPKFLATPLNKVQGGSNPIEIKAKALMEFIKTASPKEKNEALRKFFDDDLITTTKNVRFLLESGAAPLIEEFAKENPKNFSLLIADPKAYEKMLPETTALVLNDAYNSRIVKIVNGMSEESLRNVVPLISKRLLALFREDIEFAARVLSISAPLDRKKIFDQLDFNTAKLIKKRMPLQQADFCIIDDLPKADRTIFFNNALEQISELHSSDRHVPLKRIAIDIGLLPEADRSCAFNSILAQSLELPLEARPTLLRILATRICCLPEGADRTLAFNRLLAQTHELSFDDCSHLLDKLTASVSSLRSADVRSAFESVLERTNKLPPKFRRVPLSNLAYNINQLQEADRTSAFKLVLDQTRDVPAYIWGTTPLFPLASSIRLLPRTFRKTAFDRVLQQSIKLPLEADRAAVTASLEANKESIIPRETTGRLLGLNRNLLQYTLSFLSNDEKDVLPDVKNKRLSRSLNNAGLEAIQKSDVISFKAEYLMKSMTSEDELYFGRPIKQKDADALLKFFRENLVETEVKDLPKLLKCFEGGKHKSRIRNYMIRALLESGQTSVVNEMAKTNPKEFSELAIDFSDFKKMEPKSSALVLNEMRFGDIRKHLSDLNRARYVHSTEIMKSLNQTALTGAFESGLEYGWREFSQYIFYGKNSSERDEIFKLLPPETVEKIKNKSPHLR